MAVITVSRGLGAGGDEIAWRVADRLGIPYLDREISKAVADEAGVSAESLNDLERVPSLLNRMLDYLARYPAEDGFHWPYDPGIRSSDMSERYRRLLESFVRSVAERGPAVIVGHGASAILAQNPRVVRCLFVAPNHVRIARVMEHEGVDARRAEARINETDKTWRSYLKTFHNIDWIHPANYDLVVNTSRVDIDDAAELVVATARMIDERAAVGVR